VAGLLRPEAYNHPADDLVLRDTHISWVVLAGRFAYKLKKPVNLGFVDFSTFERRAADCDEEVRLNRRLCPDVYLGVVEVVQRGSTYHVGGRGTPVESAVHMRRLPEVGMLLNLLARGEVDPSLIRRIARRLARFHASAATGPGVEEYGGLTTIRSNWDENFLTTESFIDRTLTARHRDHIRRFVDEFLQANVALFERRVAGGRIRDGHGDLHLASICIEGRRLHLFDCIEFAARFRCADVAAEVAFLAMDLDHRARADLAAAFVDAYIQHSGDAELRQLLDFYTCYRAYVRGKVLSLRLDEPGLTREEAGHTRAEATAYFDLAWSYAGGLPAPMLIMVMGLPASGKTTLAEALAGRLGLVLLSSDLVRKQLAGLTPDRRHHDAFARGLYAPAMTRRTYAALVQRAGHWLRRGHSVVLDATFGSPDERAAARRLAARTKAQLVTFVCRADEEVLVKRLSNRETERKGASDARLELWPQLRAAFVEPTEMEDVISVSAGESPATAVSQAMSVLAHASRRGPMA
jgi:aminoglycoside phosphotransferase family enzyme/predicted kinase